MELAEMICLPALCTSPLKGRVIGFFGRGRGADVRVHLGSGRRILQVSRGGERRELEARGGVRVRSL